MSVSVFAHGFGDPADLGLPLPLLLALAGGAIVGFAGLLSSSARSDQHVRAAGRFRPFPPVVTRIADAPVTRTGLRVLTLLLLAALVALGLLGVDRADVNPVPRLVFVIFWGGLVPASLIFGPVWRVMNPLRGISAALARLTGDPREQTVRPLPEGLGLWPAAVGLFAFSWMERVGDDRPSSVLLFVVLYAIAQIGAALIYGQKWYARGDAFELYSQLLGRVAPVGRDAQGRLGVRSPLPAITGGTHPPGLLAALAVLIGANVFESVTESAWWMRRVFTLRGAAEPLMATVLLVLCVVVVAGLIRVGSQRPFLLPVFVPLVAAYAASHHALPLLIDGQTVLAQLSDPLGRGDDLLGMTGQGAIIFLPAAAGAALQLLAVVGYHLIAVAAAHRAALARFDLRGARAVQFPARAVLTISVVCAIALRTAGS